MIENLFYLFYTYFHSRWLRVGPGFPIDGVHLDLPNFKVIPGEGLYLKHVLPSQDGFYECQAISVVGTNSIGKYELSSRSKNLPSKRERKARLRKEWNC